MKPSVNTMAATIPALDNRDTMNYLPVASHKIPCRTIAAAYSGNVSTVKVRDSFYYWTFYLCGTDP